MVFIGNPLPFFFGGFSLSSLFHQSATRLCAPGARVTACVAERLAEKEMKKGFIKESKGGPGNVKQASLSLSFTATVSSRKGGSICTLVGSTACLGILIEFAHQYMLLSAYVKEIAQTHAYADELTHTRSRARQNTSGLYSDMPDKKPAKVAAMKLGVRDHAGNVCVRVLSPSHRYRCSELLEMLE